MSTQDLVDRPKTNREISREDRDVLYRLEAIHERNQEKEWRATADRLEDLRCAFSAERRANFPIGDLDEIKRGVRDQQESDPRGPGQRYRSLMTAKESGFDLDGMKDLHSKVYGDVRDVITKRSFFSLHESLLGSVADIFERPPFLFVEPDPDKEQVFLPPYDGSWDRFNQSQASGDGAVTENTSQLDGNGRLGSRLIARNHDAGDVDLLCAYREGGYLMKFRTLRTGILQVKADLTCLFCRHHISTYDEWGWSDFHATTRGRLIMAVFWNWEDVDPANEVSQQWFVGGLDCSGDGESYPGTSVQAVPGERRILNLFSEMAFPANRDVWVYVGLSDKIWAILNDVSIDLSIDSSWLLNSVAIRSI